MNLGGNHQSPVPSLCTNESQIESVQSFMPHVSGSNNTQPFATVKPSTAFIQAVVTSTSTYNHPLSASTISPADGFNKGQSHLGTTLGFLTKSDSAAAQISHHTLSNKHASDVANIFYPPNTQALPMDRSQVGPIERDAGHFLSVSTNSATMDLLNAYKMAVADGNSDGFKSRDLSAISVRNDNNIFVNVKPVHVNTSMGKMDTSQIDVNDPVLTFVTHAKKMDPNKVIGNSSMKISGDNNVDDKGDANSMLRRILTMKDEDNLPLNNDLYRRSPTPGHSPPESELSSPIAGLIDGNTQSTLIEKSEKLRLSSDAQNEDDLHCDFWTSVASFPTSAMEEVVPSKVHRGTDDLDASSVPVSVPPVEKLFDAGGATSCSSFVFTKFGTELSGVFTFGKSDTATILTTCSDTKVSGFASSAKVSDVVRLPTASVRPSNRKQKDPGLTAQFPSKIGNLELRIMTQPEEQHRARYLTEGSRGAVKDRSQQGYPVIKLFGYEETATLQIFIGNEAGRIKPHGFYQACKVYGKNSTQCNEREIDGTTVIETDLLPANDMQVNLDCVGILKLRNADVEKRIGLAKAKAKKKNSTKARLIFRVSVPRSDGTFLTLQIASTPILCTQPIGQPEISRMSLSELCVNETNDLFIIGRNFLKGTQVIFQQLGSDDTQVVWQSEAEIDAEHFQQTHLICKVPEYWKTDIRHPAHVQIIVQSGGKTSDPHDFVYKPAVVLKPEDELMETDQNSMDKKAALFGVSPVALKLNRLVERSQNPSTGSLFQLPAGTVPNVSPPSSLNTSPTQSASRPNLFSTSALSVDHVDGGKNQASSQPVQLVLPSSLSVGQTLTLDSRQLGSSMPPQFLFMNSTSDTNHVVSQPVQLPSNKSQGNNNILLNSLPLDGTAVVSSGQADHMSNQGQSAATTTAPMILILTSPTSTSSTTSNVQQQQASNQQVTGGGQGVVLRFLPYRR